MFGKDEIKGENVVKVLYFNTENSFLQKDVTIKEDGTIKIGNKTWEVAHSIPYLKANDGIFSKKTVEPFYILTHDSALPYRLNIQKSDNIKDDPMILDELVNFKALKQMMNFKIMKEGQMGGEGNKWIKFVIFGVLAVGAWFIIRYVWLGAGA